MTTENATTTDNRPPEKEVPVKMEESPEPSINQDTTATTVAIAATTDTVKDATTMPEKTPSTSSNLPIGQDNVVAASAAAAKIILLDNAPGEGKRLVVNKSKEHGYHEYLTLRRQMKRSFSDATQDDERNSILNQFLDRFYFVQKDLVTPLDNVAAKNKIVQDLFETKTFTPLPTSHSKQPATLPSSNHKTTTGRSKDSSRDSEEEDDDDDEAAAAKEGSNPKKKATSWKIWDNDKIVVQYGKYARKNTEYLKFRAEWKEKYQQGTEEQREQIIDSALKKFTFVREDDGRELIGNAAWVKVQKDFERNAVLPTRRYHDDSANHDHDDDETEEEDDEEETIRTSQPSSTKKANNPVHSDQNDKAITPVAGTNSSGKTEERRNIQADNPTEAISEAVPNAEEQQSPPPTTETNIGDQVVERSVVYLGRSMKRNEEYIRLRIEWKPKYLASKPPGRARIVDEMLRRFSFQQEDGTELDPEAARKKVNKDFFTELRSPNSAPRRTDSREPEWKSKEHEGSSAKKSIVQLGDDAPRNNFYWRLTAEWKPKYKVGKTEERKRIVDHILNRFSFLKNGTELSREDATNKVVEDLDDEESADEMDHTHSPRRSRQHLLAADNSKSFELDNSHQSKRRKGPANSTSSSTFQASESGKLVVYGGASRAEGNLIYIALLKEKKWDYINAETEEEAEKIVDEILDTFVFHNFSPEAARKKVSQGLQEIGERIPTSDFRWKSNEHRGSTQTKQSRTFQNRNSTTSKGRPKRRLSESSSGSSSPPQKRLRHSVGSRMHDAPNSDAAMNTRMSTLGLRRKIPVLVEEKLDVEPLSSPPPIPQLPDDGPVRYSFDEESRVVVVDFSKAKIITDRDKAMLNCLMQRDDLSVVSEGLMNRPFYLGEFLQNVELQFQGRTYHKFRRFDRVQQGEFYSYLEAEGYVSMKVSCYIQYLKLLFRGPEHEDMDFSFTYSYFDSSEQEKKETIDDYRHVAFYMTDIEMPNLLPKSYNEFFLESFRMPEILPGGKWCMLNVLPISARPFMGPNVYIAPGGGYTQFHQDGHGTVDSGHLCLHGFNEVVMLRRIPEPHKINVFATIPMLKSSRTTTQAKHALYQLPHDDAYDKENKALWPTVTTINEWKRMNYCPSVFTLKPGQHLHINKGRIHAFRKLSFDPLPSDDCHKELRETIRQVYQSYKQAPLCVSIAWDWERFGYDSISINEEVSSSLECAELCRLYEKKSLAIPEISILQIASHLVDKVDESFNCFGDGQVPAPAVPSANEIAKGILPSLEKIVKKVDGCEEVHQAQLPDTYHDPLSYHIDPFGNDYFCKLCSKELSNVYYHCNGCEELLQRDFNICSHCFADEKYKTNIHMHALDTRMASDIHHTGKFVNRRNSKDCCHRSNCRICVQRGDYFCKTCSCTCHLRFSQHMRLFSEEEVDGIVKHCRKVAGVQPLEEESKSSFVFDVEEAPRRTDLKDTTTLPWGTDKQISCDIGVKEAQNQDDNRNDKNGINTTLPVKPDSSVPGTYDVETSSSSQEQSVKTELIIDQC